MPKYKTTLLAQKLIDECKTTKGKSLDLGNCGLTEFPMEVLELTWVEELNFKSEYVEDDRRFICPNRGTPNKIESFPLLNRLEYLKLLRLGGLSNDENTFWKVKDISFLSIPTLENLDISCSHVDDLSPLKVLNGLRTLNISNNSVSDINPLSKLHELRSLNLFDNRLNNLIPLIELSALRVLIVSWNKITDISPIGELQSLQICRFDSNEVIDPAPLEKLTKIKELNFNHNQISDLSFLEDLCSLVTLKFVDNQIQDISSLFNLKKLKTLNFSYNVVVDLRPLAALEDLENLTFFHNKVTRIDDLKHLQKLKTLDFSYNKISELNSLIHMSKLRRLRFSANQIVELSPVSFLKGLRYLDFSFNRVEDLIALGKLRSLKQLNLNGNNVSDLVPIISLFEIKDCEINCNGNPFVIPLEVRSKGKKATIEYIRNREIKTIKEGRLIVLGNSNVGKTHFVNRLLYGNDKAKLLEENKKTVSTHGLLQRDWVFKGNTVHIQDFGGQDYYHDSHHLFFGYRLRYLLLFVKNPALKGRDSVNLTYCDSNNMTIQKNEDIELFDVNFWLDSIIYHVYRKKIKDDDLFIDGHLFSLDLIGKFLNKGIDLRGRLLDNEIEDPVKPQNRMVKEELGLHIRENGLSWRPFLRWSREYEKKYGGPFVETDLLKRLWIEIRALFLEDVYAIVVQNKIDVGHRKVGHCVNEEIYPFVLNSEEAVSAITGEHFIEIIEKLLKPIFDGSWAHQVEDGDSSGYFKRGSTPGLELKVPPAHLIMRNWLQKKGKTTISVTLDEVKAEFETVYARIQPDFMVTSETVKLFKTFVEQWAVALCFESIGNKLFINPAQLIELIYSILSKDLHYSLGVFTEEEALQRLSIKYDEKKLGRKNMHSDLAALLIIMRDFKMIFLHPLKKDKWVAPQYLDHKEPEAIAKIKRTTLRIIAKYKFSGYFNRFVILEFFNYAVAHILSVDLEPVWYKHGILIGVEKELIYIHFNTDNQAIEIWHGQTLGKMSFWSEVYNCFRAILSGLEYELEVSLKGEIDTFKTESQILDQLAGLISKDHKDFIHNINEYRFLIPSDKFRKKVFVSYSHQDLSKLENLFKDLDALEEWEEIGSWIDFKMVPGEKWNDEIMKECLNSDFVMFFASRDSLLSEYIKEVEIEIGRRGKKLLLIKIDDCVVEDISQLNQYEFLIDSKLTVDGSGKLIQGWEKQVTGALKKLIK